MNAHSRAPAPPPNARADQFAAELDRIRGHFLDNLYVRCIEIDGLVETIKRTGAVSEDQAAGIAARAHKVAGVAPTLGYGYLGDMARQVEMVWSDALDPERCLANVALTEEFLDEIEQILDEDT